MMIKRQITAQEMAQEIKDDSSIAVSGFVGTGTPDELFKAIEEQFLTNGHPTNLHLIYAAGIGDGQEKGLNYLAHPKLVKRVIGGHWGLEPKMQKLVFNNEIEAYDYPQGVISTMFRDIAAKKPCTLSRVGINTFVDPRIEGGKLNSVSTEDLIQLTEFCGQEHLLYSFPKKLNVALIRGTEADEHGNISLAEESLSLEGLAMAMAVKNSGGKVYVQVKRVVRFGTIDPMHVKIPGLYVDALIVTSDEQNHQQTYAEQFNPNYVSHRQVASDKEDVYPLNERKIIARRSAMILHKDDQILNYGIGVPEVIANVLKEEGYGDDFIPTVEPGAIGGTPAGGLSFGSSAFCDAIIDQPYQFDFYHGGGIDVAYLGLAQCDQYGNINVSKFGPKIAGSGGFIDITQNTDTVVFCGTFTAGGLKTACEDGQLKIVNEGKINKFIKDVEQITFSGPQAIKNGQKIYYVTERAVFKLVASGLELIEIAKGLDLQKDILDHMDFEPLIADDLQEMDSTIFNQGKMNLTLLGS